MISPIAPGILRDHSAIQEAFRSDDPLPRFIIIPGFLRKPLLDDVVIACRKGRYSTFCSYSRSEKSGQVRSEFSEPREDAIYVSVHQRPIRRIAALKRLRRLFQRRESTQTLSDLTGIRLTKMVQPDVLTCWGPGAFVERHTDHTPELGVRLILSLSLTTDWQIGFGGATVFAWRGVNRAVRLQPRANTAVLFVPFPGSFHWVEQISENAPSRRRFTWTAAFG